MDWGSWPGSTSFLPMMDELTRLAVSGKLRGNAQTVGEVLEEAIPSEGLDVDVEVSTYRPRTQSDEAEAGKAAESAPNPRATSASFAGPKPT